MNFGGGDGNASQHFKNGSSQRDIQAYNYQNSDFNYTFKNSIFYNRQIISQNGWIYFTCTHKNNLNFLKKLVKLYFLK